GLPDLGQQVLVLVVDEDQRRLTACRIATAGTTHEREALRTIVGAPNQQNAVIIRAEGVAACRELLIGDDKGKGYLRDHPLLRASGADTDPEEYRREHRRPGDETHNLSRHGRRSYSHRRKTGATRVSVFPRGDLRVALAAMWRDGVLASKVPQIVNAA